MFTGIIEALGTVQSRNVHKLLIDTPWTAGEIILGQSIAINGCCLTVTEIQNKTLQFDLSEETLQKTTFSTFSNHRTVNLERAMGMNSRFDGHWVSGHIDTKAKIIDIQKTSDQNSTIFRLGGLENERMNFVPKGSIAIDGVSLTVNEVFNDGFSVSIIPHTMTHTNFSSLQIGDKVNIEFDMIGKYILKYLENYQSVMRK